MIDKETGRQMTPGHERKHSEPSPEILALESLLEGALVSFDDYGEMWEVRDAYGEKPIKFRIYMDSFTVGEDGAVIYQFDQLGLEYGAGRCLRNRARMAGVALKVLGGGDE